MLFSEIVKKVVKYSYLRDSKEACGVAELPVAELMSQNSENLFRLGLFQESIVDDNVLLPWKAVEECVGVSAALATIDDIQLVQGELELGG